MIWFDDRHSIEESGETSDAGEVRGAVPRLSREAVRGGLTDGARGVGPGLSPDVLGPHVDRRTADILIDGLFDTTRAMWEESEYTKAVRAHADRLALADFALREIATIRFLASVPWAWEALGFTAWCQQRRASLT